MGIGAILMVASGAVCLTGATMTRSRVAITAASVMLLAMVDLTALGILPAVAWSGVLLATGLFLAVTLASSTVSTSGKTPAILLAAAYPIMAWQILSHGTHDELSASSAIGEVSTHDHWAHVADPSVFGLLTTVCVVILAALLLTSTVRAIVWKRNALALDCGGMAGMLLAMQFLH